MGTLAPVPERQLKLAVKTLRGARTDIRAPRQALGQGGVTPQRVITTFW